jgi:hypothetical protein
LVEEPHGQKIDRLREKPITIVGADAKELSTIRSALNLYRTRNMEKHTEQPTMGWDLEAKAAEEISIRIPFTL